ncbi:hypothetical protein B0T14DRAFT_608188 [Immersiella caudata]|uniref:Tat pathway signal sequence n=1 Tax=Immersiella caudata TaxID=314043 RepID=A0AA39TLF4_9PEZI|nr:hypothetical protein B0T14DRAFT_608188 [Immersiella caudata]
MHHNRQHKPRSYDGEDEKLLTHPSFNDGLYIAVSSQKQPWFRSLRCLLCLHMIVVACYTALFFAALGYLSRRQTHDPPAIINTLAQPAIRLTSKVFDVNPDVAESSAWRYAGPPGYQLDQAWNELLNHSMIRLTQDEMRELGREAEGVRLTDSSGYLGQLTVYHNLHCVQRLHRFIHLDYYFPNITDTEYKLLHLHNVHCLDLLRQAVMCQGDASLMTMKWGTTDPVPLANSESPHQCVDWSALDGWSESRYVNVYEPGLVVHPTLGPAYDKSAPHGDIGVVVDSGAS